MAKTSYFNSSLCLPPTSTCYVTKIVIRLSIPVLLHPVTAQGYTRYQLRCIHTCTVTAYRNAVSWQCGRDSWSRNVSKVAYAVTLRACSVCCRYLAVASKGWYGYGLSWSECATWHVTAVRSSRLLYIHDAAGSRNKLGTPWYNARRKLLRHEARNESSDRNSVSCQSLVTLRRYGTR
jgi:hypothetical protein